MGIMDFFKKGKEEPVQKRQQPAEATRSTPAPSAPTTREYVIQSGDSLSKIAKQFYGNAGDWQKIYQANKDKIKNPDMIYPGHKIIIP